MKTMKWIHAAFNEATMPLVEDALVAVVGGFYDRLEQAGEAVVEIGRPDRVQVLHAFLRGSNDPRFPQDAEVVGERGLGDLGARSRTAAGLIVLIEQGFDDQ